MSLYEDKTFENLQSEMLNDTSTDVDQQEGSLIATAIGKQAVRLEEAYQDLDYVNDNMLVDTQDREHLIDSGVEAGLPIKEGSEAVVRAVINCQCEVGTEFTAMDSEYNYIVDEYIGTKDVEVTDDDGETQTETWYEYNLEAMDVGIEPGQYTGDIEPVDYLEDFEGGSIESLVKAGAEEEDTEVYRERRLSWFGAKSCAGNRAYYKEVLSDLGTIGGSKIPRRKEGETSITIYIQGADHGVPSNETVSAVKKAIDPTEYSGEGYGLAPIGHIVNVKAVEGVPINVTFTLTLRSGAEYVEIQSQVEAACGDYIGTLQGSWETETELIVRVSGFENHILDVPDVVDITGLQLNGASANITLGEYQIPTLGTVTNNQGA